MKNSIIGFLVIVVVALGFILFTRRESNQQVIVNDQPSVDESIQPGKTLDLSNENLSELTKDILDNDTVTTLNVSGNNLTGALPAEIRKLVNLEILDASNNRMTGIPAEIGQLKKLKTANFANNAITGLPLEIGNLTNLQILDLRGNPNVSVYDIGLIRQKIPNTQILTD